MWDPNGTGRDMGPDLDNFITGHYGEDDPANEEYLEEDPRDDEPQDFDERRCEDD